jgi:uncharacterized protein Usg
VERILLLFRYGRVTIPMRPSRQGAKQMDRSFVAQLNDYRITTAEILYWMPDHRHVLQSYVWQNLDLAPRFPNLSKFLDFWDKTLEGKLHRVRVASTQLIKPAEFGFASGLYHLH